MPYLALHILWLIYGWIATPATGTISLRPDRDNSALKRKPILRYETSSGFG
jgi:hypothetical protein